MHSQTGVDFLAPWRQSLLHPSGDALWQQYVDEFRPYYRLLVDYVEDLGVRNDAMKARALIVLLAPDEAGVPIYWKRDTSSSLSCLEVGTAKLKGLSSELLRFVAAIIVAHNPDLRERAAHEESSAAAALRAYGDYIRQLLSLLPEEEAGAEGVYACYVLNDPIAFWSIDEASGYRPFEWFIANRQIPEVWKSRADEAMQTVVVAELGGKRRPRAKHEVAFRCYINAVLWYTNMHNLPYSVSLLARQVTFILDHAPSDDSAVGWHEMPTLLRLLEGDEYSQLRGRLSYFRWRQQCDSQSGLHSEADFAEAEMLLVELKANRLPYDALERRIETSRPAIERMVAEATHEKAAREAILRQMRGE